MQSSKEIACSQGTSSDARDAAAPLTVLVADDDLASIICDAMQRAGLAATPAKNGAEALELLESHRYDVAVLNYHMPRLNGAEVLNRLRKAKSAIPIVMITAWERDEIPEPLDGLDAFVTKPFPMRALIATVRELAARSKSQTPLQTS